MAARRTPSLTTENRGGPVTPAPHPASRTGDLHPCHPEVRVARDYPGTLPDNKAKEISAEWTRLRSKAEKSIENPPSGPRYMSGVAVPAPSDNHWAGPNPKQRADAKAGREADRPATPRRKAPPDDRPRYPGGASGALPMTTKRSLEEEHSRGEKAVSALGA